MQRRTLIQKYNTMPDTIKASLWNTVSSIVQKGISFITIPIFTRLLSTQEFGEVSLYLSWYSIVSILGSLNLYYSTTYNGLTKYANDKSGVIASFQSLTLFLSGIMLIHIIVFKDFWSLVTGLPNIYLCIMCVSVALFSAYNFWVAKERYDYKYKGVVVSSLFISIVSPTIAIIAIEHTVNKASARILAFTFVQIIVGLFFFYSNALRDKKVFNFQYWKYALILNVPLLPHYLASIVLSESDRIIIGNLCGKESVALYSLSYNIGMLMTIIIVAINNSYTPYIYKHLKANDNKKTAQTSFLLGAFIMCMCVMSMTVGPELVSILGPEKYKDAIWIVPPISCSVYFCFLYPVFSTIELFYEKTAFVSISSIIAAALNIFLNYIFIPKYGYYAAAYTTLLCYIIYSFMHMLFSKLILKRLKKKEEYFNEYNLFGIGAICIMMMFVNLTFYQVFLLRLILLVFELLAVVVLGLKIWPIIGEISKKP